MVEGKFEDVVNVFSEIAKLENTLGDLYAECVKKYPEEMGFWTVISREEFKHVEGIRRASEIFSRNPGLFRQTGRYNSIVLNNVIKYVKEIHAKITQGTISRKELLVSLRDIEQSVLETKGLEFLKTDNIEYIAILKRIAEETVRHKSQLSERIAKG